MKYVFIFFFFFVLNPAIAQSLKITLNTSKQGSAYLYNTITQKLDTVQYTNSICEYSPESIDKPVVYKLYFKEIQNWQYPIYLILSNELTSLKFDTLIAPKTLGSNWTNLYPNVPFFFKDPNKNKIYYKFQNTWVNFSDTIMSLSEEDLNQKKAVRKNIYTTFINDCKSLINKNHNQFVSVFIIDFLVNNNLLSTSGIKEFYYLLSPEIRQSYLGRKIRKRFELVAGKKAPDFNITDIKGVNYRLADLKGSKILLHFWSSTCAPCIKEMPQLLKLDSLQENIIIINISLDNNKQDWTNTINKLKINHQINVCDFKGMNSKIVTNYFVIGIPSYILIDENGKIIIKAQSIRKIFEKLKL